MTLLLLLLLCFVVACLSPLVQKVSGRYGGKILSLFPLALTVFLVQQIFALKAHGPRVENLSWIPSLGISLSMRLDGLSLLFSLLICGMGTLVILYTGDYLKDHPQLGRFYLFLFMFMGSMLGLVLANNLLVMFVFWELTSLSSFFLIGFLYEKEAARNAAKKALLATSIGSFIMLAGIVTLGILGNSFEITELIQNRHVFRSDILLIPLTICIGVGAVTKSAQFPFHFWLPGAMAAPSPVSAYLHSATMVKAGVYLLARLNPMFFDIEIWHYMVTVVGMYTVFMGAAVALWQTDLKRILAYSTICALGILTMTLGIGNPHASSAAMLFVLAHALYKGALFLIAGIVDHETGTRDIQQLGGLRKKLPFTAAAAVLAGLSMASFPPLLGFLAKEMILESFLEVGLLQVMCVGAIVFAGMAFVSVAGMLVWGPFFGPEKETPKQVHRAPWSMWIGPLLLGLGSIILLVWRPLEFLLSQASSNVHYQARPIHLKVWHGFNLPLLLSMLSLLGGLLLYKQRKTIRRWGQAFDRWFKYSPSELYYILLRQIYAFARWQTEKVQTGSLGFYVRSILVFALFLFFGFGLTQVDWPQFAGLSKDTRSYEYVLFILILGGTWASVRAKTKVKALVSLGVVGYSIALIYVRFSAPDLALTQFVIETLSVILCIPIFTLLPRLDVLSSKASKWRDGVIAAASGAMMTLLVLLSQHMQWHKTISSYFKQHSYTDAHGRNIVNVILVDFRGLDTMGEISVLALAAIGVYALLKFQAKGKDGSY